MWNIVTDFDALSNVNKLVLTTNLEPVDVLLIMDIFQAIYDNNYYKFDEYDFDDDLLLPFKYSDLKEMKILKNSKLYLLV